MYQTWRDLVFLNWSVEPDLIQSLLPRGLYADTFDKKAWISVLAFRMRGIHLRSMPPVPGLSAFPELSLRTLVYDDLGQPGVWFFSLDAANLLAVTLARQIYRLPYYRAKIEYEQSADSQAYSLFAKRKDKKVRKTTFEFHTGDELELPLPDSLEFFLTERYQFYSVARVDSPPCARRIHHKPLPIHQAEVHEAPHWGILEDTPLADLAQRSPELTLFSPGVDVEVFGRRDAMTRRKALEKDLGFSGYPETAFIGKIPNRN